MQFSSINIEVKVKYEWILHTYICTIQMHIQKFSKVKGTLGWKFYLMHVFKTFKNCVFTIISNKYTLSIPISLFFTFQFFWFLHCIILFYVPEIVSGGRGVYCFCRVCHSVTMPETLSLLITFEQWVQELSWVPTF